METTQQQSSLGVFDFATNSIPLDKYSSAVSPEGSRSHRWIHDVRKDLLTLTFKMVDISTSSQQNEMQLFMAVTAGRDSLEHLEVRKLVNWSQEHDESIRRGLISSVTGPPVQVVVKPPCIAIRYPGTSQMVRRFQLKFKNEQQYYQALNILKRLGLPLREAVSVPISDTMSQGRDAACNSSVASIPTPHLPHGFLEDPQRVPLTGPLAESHLRPPQALHRALIPPRSETSSSLSMGQSGTFAEDLDNIRSSSSLGFIAKDTLTSDYFCLQPPPPPPRPYSSTSLAGHRPSIYASQIETKENLAVSSGALAANDKNGHELTKKSTSETISHLPPCSGPTQEIYQNVLENSRQLSNNKQLENSSTKTSSLTTQQPPDNSKIRRSATTIQFPSNPYLFHGSEDLQLGRQGSLSVTGTLQMPASVADECLYTNQWIPPKRELPFSKSKEPKNALRPVSKLSSSSKYDTLLQTTNTVSSEIRTDTKPLTDSYRKQGERASRKTKTPPQFALSPVLEIPDSTEAARPRSTPGIIRAEEPSPLALKSTGITRPSTAPGLNPKATTSLKRTNDAPVKTNLVKKVKMVDTSTQTQTISGRDHTAPIARATAPTVEEVSPIIVPEPPQPVAIDKTPPLPDNLFSDLDSLVTKFGGKRKPLEIWDTPGWTEVTDEERHSMTQHWMCKQLEDPSFLDLCKHVENVWQRIGFEI